MGGKGNKAWPTFSPASAGESCAVSGESSFSGEQTAGEKQKGSKMG